MERQAQPEYPYSESILAHVRPAAFRDSVIPDDRLKLTKLEASHLQQYACQLRKLSLFDRSACLYALETTSSISLRYLVGIGGIPLYEDGVGMFRKITQRAYEELGARNFKICRQMNWKDANITRHLQQRALLLNKCILKNQALCRAFINIIFPTSTQIIETSLKYVSQKTIQKDICTFSTQLSLFDSLYLIKEIEKSIIFDLLSTEQLSKTPKNSQLSEQAMMGIIALSLKLRWFNPPRYHQRVFTDNFGLIEKIRQRIPLQLMSTGANEHLIVKIRMEMEQLASKRSIETAWLRPLEMDQAPGERRADSCCWWFYRRKMPDKCSSLFFSYSQESSTETIEKLLKLFKKQK